MSTQLLVLNTTSETPPPIGTNVLLWVEVDSHVLDSEWVTAAKVSELAHTPLIDFSEPGVHQELCWIRDGVAVEMKTSDLWSLPTISTIPIELNLSESQERITV
jgi:hypothetical protein